MYSVEVTWFSDIAGHFRSEFAKSNPLVIVALFFTSLLLAALIGGFFGYLASYPALRLRGDFLAIVLIAVGEIGRVFALTYEPLVGGVYGLGGIPNPLVWLGDPRMSRVFYALIALAIAFTIYLFANKLVNSPYGRVLKSVRDDELVSNVLGKNAPMVKGQVLIIGSAMAAVAGALYAFHTQFVIAKDFVPLITFTAITMVMLGGVANHIGVTLGALTLTLLDRLTRPSFFAIIGVTVKLPFDMTYARYVTIGVLIILILMFKPEGVIPEKPVKTPALEIAGTYKNPEKKP